MKPIVFLLPQAKIVNVKAKLFKYNDVLLHIRKDELWEGYKTKKWIITHQETGARFCYGDTKLECLLAMEFIFLSYDKIELEMTYSKHKIKQFDVMVRHHS